MGRNLTLLDQMSFICLVNRVNRQDLSGGFFILAAQLIRRRNNYF